MPKSYTFRNLRMQNWECIGENPKIPAKDILVSTYVGNKLRNMIKSYATKVAKSYNDIDDGGLSEDESDGTSWIYKNTKPSTFKALPKQADKDFEKGNTHGSPYLNFHAYVAKYKGELPKAKAQFYYCLVNLGVFCDNATTWNSFQFPVLEVITPYDKGFEYFAKTIKANLFKINLKTVTKTKIVNEFPRKKKTTATAEKVFAYKGKTITASTKEEAIKKVVAFSANELDDDEIADKVFKESAIITHCGPNTKYIEILVMPKAIGYKTYKCLLYCKIPSIAKVESDKKDTTKILLSSNLIKSLEKELNKHLTESSVVNGRVTSFRIRGDKKYITLGFDSIETAEERELNRLAKELDDIVSSMI